MLTKVWLHRASSSGYLWTMQVHSQANTSLKVVAVLTTTSMQHCSPQRHVLLGAAGLAYLDKQTMSVTLTTLCHGTRSISEAMCHKRDT